MKIKGILIDPANAEISPVFIDKEDAVQAINNLIESRVFTTIQVDDHNTLYVDDEALINGKSRDIKNYWKWLSHPQPIVGRAFLLGHNEEGESVDTSFVPQRVGEYAIRHNVEIVKL